MKSDYIPCNNLTYFEMCQARNWAMYVMNNTNVKLVLDVTNVDKTSKWFLLTTIPQEYGDIKLVHWIGIQKEKSLEYTNHDTTLTTLHIRFFTLSMFPLSLYVGLYDMSTMTRWGETCLIIWDRSHPEVTNSGYAEGRCPLTV